MESKPYLGMFILFCLFFSRLIFLQKHLALGSWTSKCMQYYFKSVINFEMIVRLVYTCIRESVICTMIVKPVPWQSNMYRDSQTLTVIVKPVPWLSNLYHRVRSGMIIIIFWVKDRINVWSTATCNSLHVLHYKFQPYYQVSLLILIIIVLQHLHCIS